jgi:hypothetical protein
MGNCSTSTTVVVDPYEEDHKVLPSLGKNGVEVAEFTYPSGIVYNGEWLDGQRQGKGV